MRGVATAFTGEALFAGGLDISPRFAAGKPQASVAPSIDPIAPRAGLSTRACRQFPQSFEAISSTLLEEAATEDGAKSANRPYWLAGAQPDGPSRRRRTLTSPRNAHEFRGVTGSSSIGFFTTLRRKLRRHFS